jgi:hypothetical protein
MNANMHDPVTAGDRGPVLCQRAGNTNVDLPQATVTVVPIRATLASLSSAHHPEGTPSPATDMFFWSDSPHFLNPMSCPVLPLWLCSHTCLVAVFLSRPFFSFFLLCAFISLHLIVQLTTMVWLPSSPSLSSCLFQKLPTTHTSGAQRDIRISDFKL